MSVAMSAVSLYLLSEGAGKAEFTWHAAPEGRQEMQSSFSSRMLLGALALGVVGLGCAPDLLVGRLLAAIQAFNF